MASAEPGYSCCCRGSFCSLIVGPPSRESVGWVPLLPQRHASRLEKDLHRPVTLLLEHVVGLRRLVEREAVCGKALDVEGIVIPADEGHDLVGPPPDVGLAHAD